MAWISLVIVTLLFYIPFVGLGTNIVEQDITATVPFLPVAFRIPYTGSVRLLAYSAILWAVLWAGVLLLEKTMKTDILAKLRLRHGLIYAIRPHLSNRIAVWMASLMLTLAVVKIILPILLQIVLSVVVPWLAAQIAPEIATKIIPFLMQWIILETFSIGETLPALSLLVLVANRAFQWEQRYRYDRDVRRHQDKYRQEQEDIELPAIQKGALAL